MSSVYRIGDLTLDVGRQELRRGKEAIHLGPLSYRLLLALIDAAPNVVSHDALADAVWNGRSVSPETISQRAKLLREALGDNAHDPRYIELRRGRGYRLIPPVAPCATEKAARRPGVQVTSGSMEEVNPAGAARHFGVRTIGFVIIGAVSMIAIWLVSTILPQAPPVTRDPPQVREYTQLTKSQVIFPPVPSPFPMVADATRLYFSDWRRGRLGMAQALQAGGEVVRMDFPFSDPQVESFITGMSPDRTSLLITSMVLDPRDFDFKLWLLPVVGGPPRLLGHGADGVYSPDGTHLLYTDGYAEIWLANSDMSDTRKLATAPGKVYWKQFSPDGRRIRMLIAGDDERRAIWEMPADSGTLRRVLPQWTSIDHCCGSWTADGKYFVFQATRDYRSQLWAIREADSEAGIEQSEPVQITTGALEFRRPTIAPDGKRIFAIGWQLRGEVVRYDSVAKRFVTLPGFESTSAEWLGYSRGGDRVAFISYPEAELWRSQADGSGRLRLTDPPMKAANPAWSPDGRFIAFSGKVPDEPWQGYFVSSDGGTPTPITPEERPEETPTWSPDSRYLAFHGDGNDRVQLLEIATGTITDLEDSDGLAWPRWSPDGRYIAAYCEDALCLFDIESGRRRLLMEGLQFVDYFWSSDSRYLYLIDSIFLTADRSVHRLDIRTRAIEKVAGVAGVRSAWGVWGLWVGVAPDGAPLLLRDLSIHHIYALGWLP